MLVKNQALFCNNWKRWTYRQIITYDIAVRPGPQPANIFGAGKMIVTRCCT